MISVTESAAKKIRQMIEKEGKPSGNLRVYVEGGGCSGMQYGLTFEENVRDDDEFVEYDGFKVVVDPMSRPFLDGTEIDYSDSLMDGGFKIRNPQAKTTCGCGQSFSA